MHPDMLKEFRTFAGGTPLFRTAVVAGSTGATGRYIVSELLSQGVAEKTIALTRRPLATPGDVAAALDLPAEVVRQHLDAGRLEVKPVDFARLVQDRKPQWSADLAFCAMGSAPYSEESDFTIPTAFAAAAKEGGALYMGLVSSQGANPKSWFGYMKTIGRREEQFRTIPFPLGLDIWRPGMLDRGDLAAARLKERLGHWLLPRSMQTSTKDLACAMVAGAVRGRQVSQGQGGTTIYELQDIKQIIEVVGRH
eukprot:GGOE01018127.1.p1 GENE.GGOE01018127.1~~GGOE01018127.1.p1  ORF type:complete len:252 (-),score=46.02 GGOE01018127.1:183-938(-)